VQRRLAAILSADVQGYSRMMSENEVATVQTLSASRRLITDVVESRRGRVVDMPGDNVLAEFGSAVDAVQAAIAMQADLDGRNSRLPENRRMAFRIGVNLGDVITQGQSIYGDGVNTAARIEALAEAGGICISGKVYEEVRHKLELKFVDLGEQTLKNIANPVHVYRVEVPGVTRTGSDTPHKAETQPRPAKPSIIVLPLTNMSATTDDEFFADGLTEDILTDLSRFRELFVISRNTAFKYKGKAVNVQQVARELGVQYVIEGSVRRAGNRVRVTVQLIDGESDRHIWAERYDRDLADNFEIQDEITRAIVATLPGRMEAATRERAARKPTGNMAAYECVITAKVLHHRSDRGENDKALELIERAITLDQKYAHAHAWRACILGQRWIYNWTDDRLALEREIERELGIALGLDDNDSDVHRILAAVNITKHIFDQASYHQSRALELNPNDDLIVVQQGELLTWLGQADEGIEWIQRAMRLNPFHPPRFWSHLGRAYFVARRYPEAVEALQHVTTSDPMHLALLSACHAQSGKDAAARACAAELLERQPSFAVSHCLSLLHYKEARDLEHHRDALLKAGLPQ
jgi:adenylate cyclase